MGAATACVHGIILSMTLILLLKSTKLCDALTAAEQQELLNIHNKLRAGLNASNMQVMTWNSNLAYMAQNWSNSCQWAHGQAVNSSTLAAMKIGQNMFGASGASINLTAAVLSWYNEKIYYNYTTNTCATGQVCLHYTQVVWSESNQLGCGYTACSTGVILVCNYGPGGNSGGVSPYKSGPACTQCSSGSFYCNNNGLCDNSCQAASSTCVCKAACKNCGKATTNCRCQCGAGWTGVDCSSICKNMNANCDPAPGTAGWPKSWCGNPSYPYVSENCPLMCGTCVPTVCPIGFSYLSETGSCYMIVNQALTQLNAQLSCASKGSHLAYVDSVAEKNAIMTLWNSLYPWQTGQISAWIGACRVNSNPNSFVWSSNCSQTGPLANTATVPMTYTSWLPPYEPNNYGGNEWCVEMYNIAGVGYIWNDLDCNFSTRGFYICEKEC